ncbi:MAG: hypothetical protein JOZ72_16665 [Alphaproteobacteria bacterium]|nr:hypothetical protein [Alphaproteobacteria bacterium]
MLRLCTTAFALCAALVGEAHAALAITYGQTTNLRCSGGVCVATAPDATFGIKEIQKRLAYGDLTVVADDLAGDIVVDAPFHWASAHDLELFAAHDIRIDKTIDVAGPGGVTLTSNDGRTDGTLSFGPGGNVHFWATTNALTINYAPYALVNSLPALIGAIAAHPSNNYALAADWDADAHGTYLSVPVPTLFHGAFDGLGHAIEHLRVRPDSAGNGFAGLFYSVAKEGSVAHLKLTAARFWGRYGKTVGGIAVLNQGLLTGNSVQGTFSAIQSNMGGVVGSNSGTVLDCHAQVQMSSTNGGGLGGIAANNLAGAMIDRSSSKGALSGSGLAFVGGLAAANAGTISRSWSSANATTGNGTNHSASAAGGLVGINADRSASVSIVNSHATGDAAAGSDALAGGLTGASRFDGTISAVYATGAVSGGARSFVGGMTGEYDSEGLSFASSYWDLDTSGVSNPAHGAGNIDSAPGITGLSDAALKAALPSGFDPAVWGRDPGINGGLPYLLSNLPN